MSEPYIIKPTSVVVDDTLPPLGKGGFGIVRKGMWCGTQLAVKVLKDQALTKEELEDFMLEARTTQAIPRHKNILTFIGVIKKPVYALIMELMPKGSLDNLLHSVESLAWDERKRIARDIACGMWGLHEANVFHCDLKSLNVLLAEDGTAKVADFGLSQKIIAEQMVRNFDDLTRNIDGVDGNEFMALCIIGGSRPWTAPELFTNTPKYTNECDVFSYAITLTELFTMAGPYGIKIKPATLEMELRLKNAMNVVRSGERPQLPSDIPDDLSKLVKECWAHEPKQRPSFSSIVERLDSSGSAPVHNDAPYEHSPPHVGEQIGRLSPAAQLPTPTPTLTPPKSASASLSGSAASGSAPVHNDARDELIFSTSASHSPPHVGEQIGRLSPATQLPTPTSTPPKSASGSSSGSAASTVNPKELEKLYERGRALDPSFGDEASRNHSAAFERYHKAAIAGHPASQDAVGFKLGTGWALRKMWQRR
ncbi:hypothetical protein HK104_009442 [Borealophlyctis nickersoniae]|nr:hypothetical protein HK104_009442 [Borealophlyctis nickersoniae]